MVRWRWVSAATTTVAAVAASAAEPGFAQGLPGAEAATELPGDAADDWSDAFWTRELQARPTFEWYEVAWSRVRHLLPPSEPGPLLHAGCGTSAWPRQMADAGLADAVHIDGSTALIEVLKHRDPDLHFEAVDAKALDFPNGTFGTVVEKGLLDALMLGSHTAAVAAAGELHRVLRPGGTLLSISMYGGPGEEGPVLGAVPWASQVHAELPTSAGGDDGSGGAGGIGAGFGGGVAAWGAYICRKHAAPPQRVEAEATGGIVAATAGGVCSSDACSAGGRRG